MSKIILQDTNSGHNLQTINDNFRKIEDEFNKKVLYRNNPSGEPNEMENDLDMNGKHIYNLPKPVEGHEPLRLVDIGLLPEEIKEYAEESKEWAEKSQDAYENTLEVLSEGSVYIGDYGPGLVIEEYTNFFGRDGIWWRPSPDLELPYTTTGDWVSESGLFVAVGDAALRQELADGESEEKGASLVASTMVVVDSVSALQNIAIPASRVAASNQLFRVLDYHGGWEVDGRMPRGGGDFRYDPDSTADVDGGVVISGPGGVGRFVRIITDYVSPDFWGALGNGVTDDTAAIQSAVTYYPINEGDAGVITPKGFANGGRVRISRGRYVVSETIHLRRGIRLSGEGKESSQIISLCLSSVLQYRDQGRYHPDEIKIENLSIWQDPSVTATGGAGIDIIDSTFVDPQSITPTIENVTVEGCYHGIRVGAVIGGAIRDSLVSKSVSHGIVIKTGVTSTSITFQNTYSQQNGGDGYYFDSSAYASLVSCASDSNGGFGYAIRDARTVSMVSCGAEANSSGAAFFLRCDAANINLYGIANSGSGITTDTCRYMNFMGCHLDGDGPLGIHVSSPTGPTVIVGCSFYGNYAAHPHNNPIYLTVINSDPTGEIYTSRGVIRMLSPTGPIIRAGNGSPEGGITAPPGSLWMRTDAGPGVPSLYMKGSGSGNTGWLGVQQRT